VTGGLPESEERFKHVELHPAPVLPTGKQRLPIVSLELVVSRSFAAIQLHENRLLRARRELRGHLVFRPAQDERAQSARQERAALLADPLPRFEGPAKERRSAQESGVQELHEAPELS